MTGDSELESARTERLVAGFDLAAWRTMTDDEKYQWSLEFARSLQRSFGIEPNA